MRCRLSCVLSMLMLLLVSVSLVQAPLSAHTMPLSVAQIFFFEDGTFRIELRFDVDSSIGTLADPNDDVLRLSIAYARARMTGTGETELALLAQMICDEVALEFSGTLVHPVLQHVDLGDASSAQRQQRAVFVGQVPRVLTHCRWHGHPLLPMVHVQMSRRQRIEGAGSGSGASSGTTQDAESAPYMEIVVGHQSSQQWDGVPSSSGDVLQTYLYQGVVHVIPLGFDHILFIIALFFMCRSRAAVLRQVSAFTCAHSLTLGMTMAGMTLPLWMIGLIEPCIALSIVIVAVDSCYAQRKCQTPQALRPQRRPYMVCVYGLIHGMGFAGALGALGIPRDFFWLALVSFNVGIEVAQVCILACLALVLCQWMHRPWYQQRVVMPLTLAIALCASWMFFMRL